MYVSDAVRKRIKELSETKGISLYRLERETAISHSTMKAIMRGKTKDITLSTIITIVSGFNIGLSEFFDSELFDYNINDFDN